MKNSESIIKTTETGCCPRFNSSPWNEKKVSWDNKLFIKDRVKSIFHIPLNFGTVVIKNMKLLETEKANNADNLMLSDENSLWGADLYFATDKFVPSAKMEKISGTFLTRVFEGPFSNVGKWTKEMQQYITSKGKTAKRIFFWYTTCPKCAKVYGKNHVVLFAEI